MRNLDIHRNMFQHLLTNPLRYKEIVHLDYVNTALLIRVLLLFIRRHKVHVIKVQNIESEFYKHISFCQLPAGNRQRIITLTCFDYENVFIL